jgi:hypothetical protein
MLLKILEEKEDMADLEAVLPLIHGESYYSLAEEGLVYSILSAGMYETKLIAWIEPVVEWNSNKFAKYVIRHKKALHANDLGEVNTSDLFDEKNSILFNGKE